MAAGFVYRCPNTGLNVQGWIESEPADGEADLYEAVTCTACARVHLVNPKTGTLFGEDAFDLEPQAGCTAGAAARPQSKGRVG